MSRPGPAGSPVVCLAGKRAAVTGASGDIGRAIAVALAAAGADGTRICALASMARLDVTLEPTGAPELPEEARLPMRKLIDEIAGYLEQTWDLMVRQAGDYHHRGV